VLRLPCIRPLTIAFPLSLLCRLTSNNDAYAFIKDGLLHRHLVQLFSRADTEYRITEIHHTHPAIHITATVCTTYITDYIDMTQIMVTAIIETTMESDTHPHTPHTHHTQSHTHLTNTYTHARANAHTHTHTHTHTQTQYSPLHVGTKLQTKNVHVLLVSVILLSEYNSSFVRAVSEYRLHQSTDAV
jgi:hypothetical protein